MQLLWNVSLFSNSASVCPRALTLVPAQDTMELEVSLDSEENIFRPKP